MTAENGNTQYDVAKYCDWSWHINGEEAEDDVSDYLKEAFAAYDWGCEQCPYCQTPMTRAGFEDIGDDDAERKLHRSYEVGSCHKCAFWEFRGYESENRCMGYQSFMLVSSVAAKFPGPLPEGCSTELAQYIRRYPSSWHTMSPRRLEELVAAIYRANHSGCEVKHVGRPGDLGIDVLFIDAGQRRHLIQVKRRSKPGKSEGFATLQSVLGTMALTGDRHAAVVSTADYFSHQARKQCLLAREQGFIIELVDKGLLDRMLSPLIPIRPWIEVLNQTDFEALDDEVKRHLCSNFPNPCQGALF